MQLNEVRSQQSIRFPQSYKNSTSESVTALLNVLFPEQKQEEKEIKEVKAILGELIETLNLDEIQTLITEIQYLVSTWLDSYEKEVFKGKTLKEILNEG